MISVLNTNVQVLTVYLSYFTLPFAITSAKQFSEIDLVNGYFENALKQSEHLDFNNINFQYAGAKIRKFPHHPHHNNHHHLYPHPYHHKPVKMSGKQKKMGDYVTSTKDNSKKRNRDNVDDESAAKKVKSSQVDLNGINFKCDKKSLSNKVWNTKIVSWNVAGLRAWLKKDVLDYIKKENPDILCLQETKCTEKQMPEDAKLPGYKFYLNAASKPGYSGVALYSKKKPLNIRMGKEIKELNDDEGRVIEAEYDNFIVVATYIPNSGQGLKTLPKRMKWDEEFRNYLKGLDTKKPVILAGDLNVAHKEIDLKNPSTNTKTAGFTQEERDNMSLLLKQGFVDTFRHLYPDLEGAYTFWTYFSNARARNVGWRIDYFLMSDRLKESICDNVIRHEVLGSDHCPIVLYASI